MITFPEVLRDQECTHVKKQGKLDLSDDHAIVDVEAMIEEAAPAIVKAARSIGADELQQLHVACDAPGEGVRIRLRSMGEKFPMTPAGHNP